MNERQQGRRYCVDFLEDVLLLRRRCALNFLTSKISIKMSAQKSYLPRLPTIFWLISRQKNPFIHSLIQTFLCIFMVQQLLLIYYDWDTEINKTGSLLLGGYNSGREVSSWRYDWTTQLIPIFQLKTRCGTADISSCLPITHSLLGGYIYLSF